MSITEPQKCEKCGNFLSTTIAESPVTRTSARKGRFMKTKEVARELGVSVRYLEDKRKEAPEDSVWAQCQKGLYHVMQVDIMELLQMNKIKLEKGEARWALFKDNLDWANEQNIAQVKEKTKKKGKGGGS